VTIAGFREPGYLWKLGIPFVWGPVGGTQNYPWRFLPRAGVAGAIREGGRGLLNVLEFRFSPRVRAATRRAAAILAANSTARRDFENVHGRSTCIMPATGSEAPADKTPPAAPPHASLRILWCGELGHHKALHLLIDALAGLPETVSYELRVVGSGPLERRWKRRAARAGIAARCTCRAGLSTAKSCVSTNGPTSSPSRA